MKEPPKSGRRRLSFVIFTVAILASLALWLSEREPAYKGKRLSEWLELWGSSGDEDEMRNAEAAIRQIGTNGIPFLLKWIRYEPRTGKQPMQALVEKLPVRLRSNRLVYRFMQNRTERRADEAEMGLAILGPQATSAIPELTRQMNNYGKTNCALSAMRSLGCIGSAALPTLMAAAEDQRCPCRFAAVATIAMNFRGTNGLPALPVLVRCAGDPDPRVGRASILAMGALKLEPQTIIAALTNRLHDPRPDIRTAAVYALGAFKEQARELLPVLSEAFKDRDVGVRLEVVAVAEKFKEQIPELALLLNEATKDTDQNVRAAAIDAVRSGHDAAQDFE